MIIVDTHCDTLTKIMDTNEGLYHNNCHIDLKRLSNFDQSVQFFACFIDTVYNKTNTSLKRVLEIIDRAYYEFDKNSDYISLCKSYDDIKRAHSQKKVAGILSIEGGEALAGELYVLRMLYELGIRSICLTWNNRNEIADGLYDDVTKGGLTSFGREVVKEMNRLGMIVDVSHLSPYGFWDVLDTTNAPIIASHSNAKSVCNHKRNLTDEQILAIHKNNGVIGINLCDEFISENNATITDIIRHIEYIASLVGVDHIGIGADFDGVDRLPSGIQGVQDVTKIFDELQRLNYKEQDIQKIAGKNFLRVIKHVIR